jgi:SNF family Na+-dependent transporter
MLALLWIILFIIMFKGANVIGKVAIYTVVIPWVLLMVLLVRGLTLPEPWKASIITSTRTGAHSSPGDIWFAAFSR